MSVQTDAAPAQVVDPREELFGTFGTDWLAEQLPGVLASDPFMQRFLRIFQDVADTVRWPADNVDHYWQPAIAPIEVVQWLGTVLGIQVETDETKWSPSRQRTFVQQVGPLFRERGTMRALAKHLAYVTGGRVAYGDSGGVRVSRHPYDPYKPHDPSAGPGGPRQRRLTIRVESTGHLSLGRFEKLVAELVPADCIFDLEIGPIAEPTTETSEQ